MSDEKPNRNILYRSLFALAKVVIFLVLCMLLPAGVRWTRGWVFLGVYLLLLAPSVFYLWRKNPEVFSACRKIHPKTKRWDKVLVFFVLFLPMAIFPVAALDDGRFHWSCVPLWLTLVGYALLLIGLAISNWALGVNKFAEPGVRIQTERGHRVVDSGPYAIVRHPLYVSAFFLFSGLPLTLGSFWAMIPAAVAILILVVRTAWEDRMLWQDLEGYRDYAARVRYRLVPGVW
jgi:protein-S-isoprenylcysteine O-methyltransferase Ste14